MRAIGIRVSPKEIFYCITEFDDENIELIDTSRLIVPKTPEFPFKLSFIRTNIFSIIQEYGIINAGVRVTESAARSTSEERISIEAIIQELFTDSCIEKYFVGQIATLASLLKVDRENIKKYRDGDKDFPGVENWSSYTKKEKESIITSVAACHL